MVDIRFSYSGDRELRAWITTREKVLRRGIVMAVGNAVDIIALDVSRMTPRAAAASGAPVRAHLADSWETRVEDEGWVVRGYVEPGEDQPAGKVGAIEFGRDDSPAPTSALIPWAAGVGMTAWDARMLGSNMKPQPPRMPMALGLAASSDTVMRMVGNAFFEAFGV